MDFWIILWIFIISLGINLIFFILAYIIKTDVFTDITYSATFLILSIIVISWKQNFSITQIVIFVLLNIWAIRTGTYLLIRILKTKVDHRFDKMRNHFFKFAGFWCLQSLSVSIIALPSLFALSIDANKFSQSFNFYSIIFIIAALTFLLIETTADIQKFLFHSKKGNKKSAFIDYGLWKDSRHPNYLGEIGFWYMILACFLLDYFMQNHDSKQFWQLLWILSPIYINLLLVKVSGVPILEMNSTKKLKNNKNYQLYVKQTPCILFIVGKRGDVSRVKKAKQNNKI